MNKTLSAHIEARTADLIAKRAAAVDKQMSIDPAHYVDVVLKARAVQYAAHIATMEIGPEMAIWAMAMRTRYKSSYVKVWHFIADWITALLILRYGEEPDGALCDGDHQGWPTSFSDDDAIRAAQLLRGERWPAGVFTLLPVEG